jgi:hypothetical protein
MENPSSSSTFGSQSPSLIEAGDSAPKPRSSAKSRFVQGESAPDGCRWSAEDSGQEVSAREPGKGRGEDQRGHAGEEQLVEFLKRHSWRVAHAAIVIFLPPLNSVSRSC